LFTILKPLLLSYRNFYFLPSDFRPGEVKEFQTLSKKFMIYGPKVPPPKYQPSIGSKSEIT
jgi:hypothetical protein